jgi:hypothetical protein
LHDYRLEGPYFISFPSPDDGKSAIIVNSGFMLGRHMDLFVSPTDSLTNLIWLGTVESDDAIDISEMSWSKDGDLVAAFCFSKGVAQQYHPFQGYTYGYRFSDLKAYVLPKSESLEFSTEALDKQDKEIERLLVEKGGKLVVATTQAYPVDSTRRFQKMGWLQWRRCRSLIEACLKERQELDNQAQPK